MLKPHFEFSVGDAALDGLLGEIVELFFVEDARCEQFVEGVGVDVGFVLFELFLQRNDLVFERGDADEIGLDVSFDCARL